jgi:hypothetical protein
MGTLCDGDERLVPHVAIETPLPCSSSLTDSQSDRTERISRRRKQSVIEGEVRKKRRRKPLKEKQETKVCRCVEAIGGLRKPR